MGSQGADSQKLAGEVADARGVKGIAEIQESVREVVTDGLGLNPNVDYYSAGLYHSLGIPPDLFTRSSPPQERLATSPI